MFQWRREDISSWLILLRNFVGLVGGRGGGRGSACWGPGGQAKHSRQKK